MAAITKAAATPHRGRDDREGFPASAALSMAKERNICALLSAIRSCLFSLSVSPVTSYRYRSAREVKDRQWDSTARLWPAALPVHLWWRLVAGNPCFAAKRGTGHGSPPAA